MKLSPDAVVISGSSRLRVFYSTIDWKQGDLLDIKGQPVVFLRLELRDLLSGGRWWNAGGSIVIYDVLGVRNIDAHELAALAKAPHIITQAGIIDA